MLSFEQPKPGRVTKTMAWLGRKLLVEEKHTAVELTQERVEKNCKNTGPLLKPTPCSESMNNQKYTRMDESRQEQLTDDDTVNLASHAGDNHLSDDYEGAEKAHKNA